MLKELRRKQNITQDELASLLEVTRQTIQRWEADETKIPKATIGYLQYEFGLKSSATAKQNQALAKSSQGAGIPLLSIAALGGSANFDLALERAQVVAEYYAPEFKDADFMLPVKGDSMIPTYRPGDVIACKILHNPSFIEWNRPHVLAVEERGVLVKRLMPGSSDQQYKFVSDNNEYPAFEVPVKEIQSIAVILGLVRVEG
ncbi:LexA family transcriptional regulator [Phaeocystidibacter marisrubri]|uniref:Helix-turn-helix domain-containing protein n=1 Tax=Phaeocystidibacter marisrubri TaxID=1577780 RepID=A0A6L3ZCD8_9FLAO|nr:LexA family transcriptional regulator [Phaeocystidibacter marisrubri]KAB2815511.1 helix-turn-helix domain-containing protein [Phaeocystidibacter marisrubri]GGH64273.1 hypothetical protein GCM10011318_00130 [Phaeocystidibacter marisrubri]